MHWIWGSITLIIFLVSSSLDDFENDLFVEFSALEFKCIRMKRNTTIYQFQDKLKEIYDEIRDGKNSQGKRVDPISLLYVIVSSHGDHRGAEFSDGRQSHIVTELRHILGLEIMKDVPVVLNASFCRDVPEGEIVTSPMPNIATNHVSLKLCALNHKS